MRKSTCEEISIATIVSCARASTLHSTTVSFRQTCRFWKSKRSTRAKLTSSLRPKLIMKGIPSQVEAGGHRCHFREEALWLSTVSTGPGSLTVAWGEEMARILRQGFLSQSSHKSSVLWTRGKRIRKPGQPMRSTSLKILLKLSQSTKILIWSLSSEDSNVLLIHALILKQTNNR